MTAALVLLAALASAGDVASSSASIDIAVKPAAPAAEGPRLRAVIHKEARDWEPVSLRAGGEPGAAGSRVVLRQRKVKKRLRGEPRAAKASARLHRAKDDAWLVISVRVPELARKRTHLELRFRIMEGYVEEVRAAAVTTQSVPVSEMDSFELRAAGLPFESIQPAEGAITVSALDPRPGRRALNSGVLKGAAFGGRDVGLADVYWSVRGVK